MSSVETVIVEPQMSQTGLMSSADPFQSEPVVCPVVVVPAEKEENLSNSLQESKKRPREPSIPSPEPSVDVGRSMACVSVRCRGLAAWIIPQRRIVASAISEVYAEDYGVVAGFEAFPPEGEAQHLVDALNDKAKEMHVDAIAWLCGQPLSCGRNLCLRVVGKRPWSTKTWDVLAKASEMSLVLKDIRMDGVDYGLNATLVDGENQLSGFASWLAEEGYEVKVDGVLWEPSLRFACAVGPIQRGKAAEQVAAALRQMEDIHRIEWEIRPAVDIPAAVRATGSQDVVLVVGKAPASVYKQLRQKTFFVDGQPIKFCAVTDRVATHASARKMPLKAMFQHLKGNPMNPNDKNEPSNSPLPSTDSTPQVSHRSNEHMDVPRTSTRRGTPDEDGFITVTGARGAKRGGRTRTGGRTKDGKPTNERNSEEGKNNTTAGHTPTAEALRKQENGSTQTQGSNPESNQLAKVCCQWLVNNTCRRANCPYAHKRNGNACSSVWCRREGHFVWNKPSAEKSTENDIAPTNAKSMPTDDIQMSGKRKKASFYAVFRGRQTGIFTEWDDVKSYVDGVSFALFAGFTDEKSARNWLMEKKNKETTSRTLQDGVEEWSPEDLSQSSSSSVLTSSSCKESHFKRFRRGERVGSSTAPGGNSLTPDATRMVAAPTPEVIGEQHSEGGIRFIDGGSQGLCFWKSMAFALMHDEEAAGIVRERVQAVYSLSDGFGLPARLLDVERTAEAWNVNIELRWRGKRRCIHGNDDNGGVVVLLVTHDGSHCDVMYERATWQGPQDVDDGWEEIALEMGDSRTLNFAHIGLGSSREGKGKQRLSDATVELEAGNEGRREKKRSKTTENKGESFQCFGCDFQSADTHALCIHAQWWIQKGQHSVPPDPWLVTIGKGFCAVHNRFYARGKRNCTLCRSEIRKEMGLVLMKEEKRQDDTEKQERENRDVEIERQGDVRTQMSPVSRSSGSSTDMPTMQTGRVVAGVARGVLSTPSNAKPNNENSRAGRNDGWGPQTKRMLLNSPRCPILRWIPKNLRFRFVLLTARLIEAALCSDLEEDWLVVYFLPKLILRVPEAGKRMEVRMTMAEEGRWKDLVEDIPSDDSKPKMHRFQLIGKAIAAEQWSKAMRLLRQGDNEIEDVSEDIVERFAVPLFPEAKETVQQGPSTVDTEMLVRTPVTGKALVRWAQRHRGKAADDGGWYAETILAMTKISQPGVGTRTLDLLALFFNRVCCGTAPAGASDCMLRSVRGFLLPKDPSGKFEVNGARPIGVASLCRRSVMSILTGKRRNADAEAVGNFQLGMRAGGLETFVFVARVLLELGFLVAKTDKANSFGNMSRAHIQREVKGTEWEANFQLLYGKPTLVKFATVDKGDVVRVMESGLVQGSGESTALEARGYRERIQKIPRGKDLVQVAFHDDEICGVAREADLQKLWNVESSDGAVFRPEKTQFTWKGTRSTEVEKAALMTVAGVPIEGIDEWKNRTRAKTELDCARIKKLAAAGYAAAAFQLLRMCVGGPRLAHAARMIAPTEDMLEFYGEIEDLRTRTLWDIFLADSHCSMDEMRSFCFDRECGLRWSHVGFEVGQRYMETVEGSLESVKEVLDKHGVEVDADKLREILLDDRWVAASITIPSMTARHNVRDETRMSSLRKGLWWQWQNAPTAGFLNTEPTRAQLSIVLKLGMGLEVFPTGSECGMCGAKPAAENNMETTRNDTYGMHALICKKGGCKVARHEAVVRTIWGFMRRAGKDPKMNGGPKVRKKMEKGVETLKPADLFTIFGQSIKAEAYDFTCVSQVTAHNIHRFERGSLVQDEIDTAVEAKVRKYAEGCDQAGVLFTPLAFDNFAGYDVRIIEAWWTDLAKSVEFVSRGFETRGAVLREIKALIAYRIVFGTADMVLRRMPMQDRMTGLGFNDNLNDAVLGDLHHIGGGVSVSSRSLPSQSLTTRILTAEGAPHNASLQAGSSCGLLGRRLRAHRTVREETVASQSNEEALGRHRDGDCERDLSHRNRGQLPHEQSELGQMVT